MPVRIAHMKMEMLVAPRLMLVRMRVQTKLACQQSRDEEQPGAHQQNASANIKAGFHVGGHQRFAEFGQQSGDGQHQRVAKRESHRKKCNPVKLPAATASKYGYGSQMVGAKSVQHTKKEDDDEQSHEEISDWRF